jgi:hypothetical protein
MARAAVPKRDALEVFLILWRVSAGISGARIRGDMGILSKCPSF